MRRTKTPRQWFDEHINKKELMKHVFNSVAEAIQSESLEGGNYIALVSDIVSGGHGRFIPVYVLKYFGYQLNIDEIDSYDMSEVIDEVEYFTNELEEVINSELDMDIKVRFGIWESDGSYCMLAYLDKDNFEERKKEALEYLKNI